MKTSAESGDGGNPKRLKPNPEEENLVPSLYHIVQTLHDTEALKNELRDNWSTEPWNVAERKEHLTPILLREYVGLEGIPDKLVQLFDDPRERPAIGMLNAVSGAGKSATLQYCERELNKPSAVPKPVTLAVTFNRTEESDGTELNGSQGLTMRIAERFLMKQGHFEAFRKMWKKNCMGVVLDDLIKDIYQLLCRRGGRQRVLILVDEPGLSGHAERVDNGSHNKFAEDVVRATSIFRMPKPKANVGTAPKMDHRLATRFVMSSLKPLFNGDNALVTETVTKGPIDWIAVPYVRGNQDMKQFIEEKLDWLKQRMPQKDFAQAIEFVLAMSSGHWATLDAIVNDLLALDLQGGFLFDYSRARNWLKTVYFQNVRDVVVQVPGRTAERASVTQNTVFADLLALTILGRQISPFKDLFLYDYGEVTHRTLSDLAYLRIVSNRIMSSDGNGFDYVVPRLSLFLIRKWCLEKKNQTFRAAVRRVLQHAGNDPTSEPRQAVQTAGTAFELVASAFHHAKFLSWILLQDRFGMPSELRMFEDGDESDSNLPFFPGHERVWGTVPGKMQRPWQSRLLCIEGKGGFRAKKEKPQRLHDEKEKDFVARKKKWLQEALVELVFEDDYVEALLNGDVICPGSKIQPHSDAITISHFVTPGGDIETGLIFDQFKFSGCDAPTRVEASHIIAGLGNLMKERGVLFDIPGTETGFGNQIANLRVKEENVVYCWSVLRNTAAIGTLRKEIATYAKDANFRGSVVVAVSDSKSDQALRQYGDTFKDLALISSSRPSQAFEG